MQLFSVLGAAVTTALLPAFSKLELAKPEVVSGFFNKANKYTCLLIVPLTLLVIILSNPLVKVIYGSGYTSAPLFLSLSCSVYLLSILGFLTLVSVFNGLGQTRLTMYMTTINFVLLLILSPLLAPFYGVIGVIVAYLISSVAASIYGVVIAVFRVKIKFDFSPTLRIYAGSLLSALPVFALMFLTSLGSGIILLIGGIAYLFIFLTLVPLVKIISVSELDGLSHVFNQFPYVRTIAKPIFSYLRILLSL